MQSRNEYSRTHVESQSASSNQEYILRRSPGRANPPATKPTQLLITGCPLSAKGRLDREFRRIRQPNRRTRIRPRMKKRTSIPQPNTTNLENRLFDSSPRTRVKSEPVRHEVLYNCREKSGTRRCSAAPLCFWRSRNRPVAENGDRHIVARTVAGFGTVDPIHSASRRGIVCGIGSPPCACGSRCLPQDPGANTRCR